VICFSLEPWNEVWRRNQLMVTELLRLRPELRLLFAETPIDVLWAVRQGQRPTSGGLRPIGDTGRLWATAPRKWLPRRIRPGTDRSLARQVLAGSRSLGFERPLLWINDCTYAPLVRATGWPSVYDITDDWLLANGDPRWLARQRTNDALALREVDEVVVCSPALAESRGRERPVHVITNGVDVDHLRRPTVRPADLPPGRIVLYQGTLSDGRLDIALCASLARGLSGRATLVFLGPNSLSKAAETELLAAGATILGARPYAAMPAYLQHADVLVVPHQVIPFTESLDPIKAREFQAVGRPVVATPVAGFRDLGAPAVVVEPAGFVAAVEAVLDLPPLPPGPGELVGEPTTWAVQAGAFLAVLDAAMSAARPPSRHGPAS
jgi:teichuronic acid biosynthesis glycosyltransferase TuaH